MVVCLCVNRSISTRIFIPAFFLKVVIIGD